MKMTYQTKLEKLWKKITRSNRTPQFIKRPFAFTAGGLFVLAAAVGGLYLQNANRANAITPPVTLGDVSYQQYDTHQLTVASQLKVNVANGNLILDTKEFEIKGTGPSLSVHRVFNNLATTQGQSGKQGIFSVGRDVSVKANADGSATYRGTTGEKATFPSNGSGGYGTTTELAAKLTTISGGGWKLTFNQSGEFYTFNAAGSQIADTDVNGNAISYAYNSDGTLASATDTQGRTTLFTNYTGTSIGKITDSTGRYTQYTYDGDRVTRADDANRNTWLEQYYDTRGNLNQLTDPRGYTTTLTYDTFNRVTSIKFNDFTSGATTWTYSYDNTNARTTITDPNGHTTKYTYDASGRVTDVKNGLNLSVGTSWDTNNNKVGSTAQTGYTTTAAYDSLNNLTKVQNPSLANGNDGAKTQYTYNDTAHPYLPSSSSDGQGNVTSYTYSTSGNLSSSSKSGSSGAVATTYKRQGDPNGTGGTIACGAKTGEVCSSIDGNGNTTTYTYDSDGNVLTVTPPSPMGRTVYTYDALSRVHTYKNGNNVTVTYAYDNMDQIKTASYSNGPTLSYSYDQNGNLISKTDGTGTTGYVVDGMNRVTKISKSGQADISYTYDGVGNLLTEQGSAGTTTYTYDAANQVTNVHQSNGNADYGFTYTNGQVTATSIPGGITQTLSYDRAGRQTGVTTKKGTVTIAGSSATYATAAGNDSELMQTETNNVTGVTSTYGYDGLNRLTAASGSAGTGSHSFTYAYDNNGNRTQYSKDGAYSAIYGYNAANELVSAGGSAYGTYDGAGNQTSNGSGLAMAYNTVNQSSSFTPSGISTISASYEDSSQTNRTALGNKSFVNGLLGMYGESGPRAISYTRLPGGSKQILSEIVNGSNYYYINDLHGSVVAVTDTNGTVQNTYTYDPYGNTLTSTGSLANSIKYSGGYFDDQTGLYKYGTRYYNSSEGRWTQLDPAKKSTGYLYAGNDPINFNDPSGTVDLYTGASFANDYYQTGVVVGGVIGCAAGAIGGLEFGPVGSAIGCLGVGSQVAFYSGVSFGLFGGLVGGIDPDFPEAPIVW